MKKIKFLLFLFLLAQVSIAQDINQCRKIVDVTIEAINKQSAEDMNDYLSDDFTIAGQKGEIAKMVLNQLLSQLGENVISYKEVSQNKLPEGIELRYNIEYEKMGSREASFVFNKDNLLKDLHLFKMEVKTMGKESKVKKSDKSIIEVAFRMAGNLIAVNVNLNGKKRTFILDSGSPRVVLNSKYISEKDSSQRNISSSKGVSGNISGMDIYKVKQLDFSGIQLNDQEVITLDLSHLEAELEMEVYGLIGFDLIKDYDLLFDYEKRKLTLIDPPAFERYKNENLSNKDLQIIPFQLAGHIPVVTGRINNEILALGIDCGAESNLIDDHLFPSLKGEVQGIKTDRLIGAEHNFKEVKSGAIQKIFIGDQKFENLPTVFNDIAHLNKAYGLNLDGLIGYPVLSMQKTLISFARKELMFIE